LPEIRVYIAKRLVEEYGIPIAEIARSPGVTTSGISRALKRSKSTQSGISLNSLIYSPPQFGQVSRLTSHIFEVDFS